LVGLDGCTYVGTSRHLEHYANVRQQQHDNFVETFLLKFN